MHHNDAPDLDPRTDITDLYVFQKPGDPSKSILILNVNPEAPTRANAFDPQASYLKTATRVKAVVLTAEDVPEMLDLVNWAQPGPFSPRTIEMGQYLGLRQDGQLVAMAGERFHLTGFCEVSAVCTRPDYRGRGYAGDLTTMVAETIIERQETPFLHVAPGNERALRLYLKLGFRIRAEIQVSILKKLAE